MRIGFVAWESLHSVRSGGLAAHVTELAAGLQRRGHEVHVFTRQAPGQGSYENHYGVHYHLTGAPIHSSFSDSVAVFNEHLAALFDRVTASVGRFAVVHAHDWLTVAAMSYVNQHHGIPAILTIHSTEYGRSGNIFSPADQSVRIIEIERLGMLCASRVIAVSEFTRNELINAYGIPAERISMVHNGCSVTELNGWIDPGAVKRRYAVAPLEPMLLFAGRSTVQKGPDLLLEAIPAVLAAYPQARFVYCGGGEMDQMLTDRAAALGVSYAVRFAGQVPRYELLDLLRACDGVIVPSRNEPFGIIVLEAWAAGKPVVVTRRGGPDEFVRDQVTGIKVSDSVPSVAAGVCQLLSDYPAACAMGVRGRQTVERTFSWDRIAAETETIYCREAQSAQTASPRQG